MKNRNFYVYAITKGKISDMNPINTFIAEKHEDATIYFQGYIVGEKEPSTFNLWAIGKLDEKLQVEPIKVFIENGYKTFRRQYEDDNEKTRKQLSFLDICRTKKMLADWQRTTNKTTEEALKIVFDGVVRK